MSSFQLIDSELLAQGGFLSLTKDRFLGPDGDEIERHVVTHPGAVVVVPFDEQTQEFVLVRQYRSAIRGELLEVPAGKRDVEGETPETTAVRELIEEIGLKPARLVKLAEFYNSPGFCNEYTHLYLALELETQTDISGGVLEVTSAEEKDMAIERLSIGAIDSLLESGEIIDAKTIIGLALATRYLNGEFAGTTQVLR